MLAKLQYVHPIVKVSIMLLCHWFVPKIQFNLMIFPWVRKTSTFLTSNLSLHRSYACIEGVRSMKLSRGGL